MNLNTHEASSLLHRYHETIKAHRDIEVVVLRYKGGVAYVETWDRALNATYDLPPPALPPHAT